MKKQKTEEYLVLSSYEKTENWGIFGVILWRRKKTENRGIFGLILWRKEKQRKQRNIWSNLMKKKNRKQRNIWCYPPLVICDRLFVWVAPYRVSASPVWVLLLQILMVPLTRKHGHHTASVWYMYLGLPRYSVVVHFIPAQLRPSNLTRFHPKKSTYPGSWDQLWSYKLWTRSRNHKVLVLCRYWWNVVIIYYEVWGDFTKLVLMSGQAEASWGKQEGLRKT